MLLFAPLTASISEKKATRTQRANFAGDTSVTGTFTEMDGGSRCTGWLSNDFLIQFLQLFENTFFALIAFG